MTIRTLVWEQLQFGLEPSAFRRGAARALARIAGRSGGEALLRALIEQRLLESAPERPGYGLTERFREFALARVVPALDRARAKRLIERAGMLAAKINAKWTRNPFVIAMIAVSGSYMSRNRNLPELNLWLIVRARTPSRSSVWGLSSSRGDAARN